MRTWPLFVGSWILAGVALVVAMRARSASAAAPVPSVVSADPPPAASSTQVIYVVGQGADAPHAAPAPAKAAVMPEEPTAPKTSAEREQNARFEREEVVGRLQASGATNEPWVRDARDLVGAWKALPDLGDVTFSPLECHRDGCVTTATYSDEDARHRIDDRLPATDAFQHWPGAKFRSGPEHAADGTVSASWVFYRPD